MFVAAVVAVAFAPAVPTASALPGTVPAAPVLTGIFAGPAPGAVALTWGAAPAGITTYKFSRSVDAGVTWSAVQSFASPSRFESSAIFPALVCPNTAPGSRGCLFRIYATNQFGTSPASKPAALWTVPDAPSLTYGAAADATFATTNLIWRGPAHSGGLAITSYDVLVSTDGAAAHVVATTTATTTAVPCVGARTCSYSVRANNSQGHSPTSPAKTITPAPGSVGLPTIENTGTNFATGISRVAIAWSPPVGGLAAVRYDVQQCDAVVGAVHPCQATSTSWKSRAGAGAATSARVSTSATCSDKVTTCFFRMRGVNGRGGAGAWRALDLEPWAPFGVKVTAGAKRGSVLVKFNGPSESGAGPKASKHYRVIVCDASCAASSSWHTASDAVPYPPTGTAPFTAGTFTCAAAHTTAQSTGGRLCQVRMQFVDGLSAVSLSSTVSHGTEHA